MNPSTKIIALVLSVVLPSVVIADTITIPAGTVVYGQLDEIRRRYSPNHVIVWTAMDLAALGVNATRQKAGAWRVELGESETAASYLNELVRSGVVVDRYEPLVARMDDIFVSLVSGGR